MFRTIPGFVNGLPYAGQILEVAGEEVSGGGEGKRGGWVEVKLIAMRKSGDKN